MFKFLKYLGKYWWLVALCVVTTLANVFLDFALPTFLGKIIDTLQTENPQVADIFFSAICMLGVALLSGLTNLGTGKISSILSARIVAQARYELYKSVGEFSFDEMNKFSVTSLVTRTTNDLTFVGTTYDLLFRFILYGPALAIAAIVLLVIKQVWVLTFIVLGALILLLLFSAIVIKIAIKPYQSIQQKLDKVSLVTRENLEGLRVVRAYNAENYQEEKFGRYNDILMRTERFANRALGVLVPGIQLIIGLLTASIYWVGGELVPEGTIKYSEITVVIQYATLMLLGFVMMTLLLVNVPRAFVCAARVNEVINTKPKVMGKETSPATSEVGTIEFKNVSYIYPGADKHVLENISFKVKQGETIAFIGATGSGKSTLINLMPRFFDPTEGEVLVDGVNVKDFNLQDLYKKFGYVPQKGYLFHDTLLNNITIGNPDAGAETVKRALEISQSIEFVKNLPDGVNYEISQGGKNVSGGQRQRLCIARAIMTNPEIFIFDDSFSALDYKTDKVLRGEIKKHCVGVTNVIVAQRVGTIIDADQIVVLDEGKMVGHGTHRELLENCPVYKEIALSQLSEEELKNGAK